jgi:gliding motility-associated-like protein
MRKFCLIILIFFSFCSEIFAQTCTAPGQNPSTAFPVCGTSTFIQNNVPICGGRALPAPGCPGDPLNDKNPFWYKFTCFKAGTLGFEITPNNLNDDYDWEIYDITGRNPNDIYTDGKLVISSNWSGDGGVTGASASGTQGIVCAGTGRPRFSSMPNLQVGHNYLMLISHFTNSQSGYKLTFKGGSGVITDSAQPKLKNVDASCGGNVLRLGIGKKIKCNSISSSGSEFYISPNAASITSATGINCSSQFDTDSLELRLSNFLPPGDYTLHIKNGSDGNTLLDYCDNSVAETNVLKFKILPKVPTAIDSIAPPECATSKIRVILSKPVLCSSIASNGSDFSITGSYPVSITGVTGNCSLTKEIILSLSKPLEQAGTFVLNLNRGTDGNTILDECGEETPAGPTVTFSVKDTVNADFSYNIQYGCATDIVQYTHPGKNGVNTWKWALDENQTSNHQNPQAIYTVFNKKFVKLVVSNGFCKDSTTTEIELKNFLKADFAAFEDNCPNEPIVFASKAVGQIVNHQWSFGDGGTASTASPSHTYTQPNRQTTFSVQYTVTDSYGCQNTVSKTMTIYSSCFLAVPTAFTPNGDGLNDKLYPLNAIKAEQVEFKVFNRWGQLIFKTSNWKEGWNGTLNGVPQATGTYIWTLNYVNRDTKKAIQEKGTVVLIR